jgi:hypothetical protein
MHDIMGALSDQGINGAVLVDGEVYTWAKLGYSRVPSEKEQDRWLRDSMIEFARAIPDLADNVRESIVDNAMTMYLGLRTIGVVWRWLRLPTR